MSSKNIALIAQITCGAAVLLVSSTAYAQSFRSVLNQQSEIAAPAGSGFQNEAAATVTASTAYDEFGNEIPVVLPDEHVESDSTIFQQTLCGCALRPEVEYQASAQFCVPVDDEAFGTPVITPFEEGAF